MPPFADRTHRRTPTSAAPPDQTEPRAVCCAERIVAYKGLIESRRSHAPTGGCRLVRTFFRPTPWQNMRGRRFTACVVSPCEPMEKIRRARLAAGGCRTEFHPMPHASGRDH